MSADSRSAKSRSADSPIEDYLDHLFPRLPRDPQRARRLLAEAEDHLRDSAQADIERGLDRVEAERRAVQRFGPVSAVASAPRVSVARLASDVLRAAWSLVAVGLVAVGVSGAVAAIMNVVAGRQFVGGTGDGVHYSTAVCRHLLQVQPTAADCARAGVLENSADAVVLRLLAGGLGLVLLVAYLAWRRWRGTSSVLPATFTPMAAVCLFGASAAVLLGLSVGAIPSDQREVGVGFFLSGGVVAALVAVGYAGMLVARLRAVEQA